VGYPMSWRRLVNRNGLTGDYRDDDDDPTGARTPRRIIAGDMRRLEHDTMDDRHLRAYALLAGVDVAQVKAIFAVFFADGPVDTPAWAATRAAAEAEE
jgi:hypothetical protein